jgi:glycosyltransferase involved in cell wall biosynthesis
MSACDAVVQEVEALRERFGGEISHLYPGRTPGTRLPRRWWGLQRLAYLRRAERKIGCHHIFNPDPYPFALLRFLRRPVVYTVVAGVRSADHAATGRLARQVTTLVVSTMADLKRLQGWGIRNVVSVCPGIDVSRFSYTALPADIAPTLLMGSAPWTREQFRTKGVDALLELAQQIPHLHLVLLWRGVLVDEIVRRVRAAGLERRVEVLTEQVDVNKILGRVHAAVVLAAEETLIKAYPHSLLEALAAGRPVLVSCSIPMATYVEQNGCGVVVEEVSAAGVQVALERLVQEYPDYQQGARDIDMRDWAVEQMLDAYGRIYNAALMQRKPGHDMD